MKADVTLHDFVTEGQSMTLLLVNAGHVVTYPHTEWFGGVPKLGVTDKIFFEKIGGVLYGTHVGSIK